MRVLGIDVGLKRTGLALSDETGTAIRFLPNLVAKNRALAIEKILCLVSEFSIRAIVIGRPEPKTPGSIAIASRADGLKKTLMDVLEAQGLQVELYLWNETLTSKKALAHLVDSDVPQKKRKALLDAASAAVLVEEFLYQRLSRLDDEK